MKTLSLWEPWATLVATEIKKVETRSWRTPYRGPLLIHASKRPVKTDELIGLGLPLIKALRAKVGSRYEYPLGHIIAVAYLKSVVRTERLAPTLTDLELAAGDYSPGRWAWQLSHVQQIAPPVFARGRQGLWEFNGKESGRVWQIYRAVRDWGSDKADDSLQDADTRPLVLRCVKGHRVDTSINMYSLLRPGNPCPIYVAHSRSQGSIYCGSMLREVETATPPTPPEEKQPGLFDVIDTQDET